MTTIPIDWSAIAPELVLLGVASALLVVGIFLPPMAQRPFAAIMAGGGFVAAMCVAASQFHNDPTYAFAHTLRIDSFGQAGRIVVYGSGLLAVLLAWGTPWLRSRTIEFSTLLLVAAGGMSMLAVCNSFVTMFVALELFSICLYILVAIDVDRLSSLEAGLKYLVVGGIGAAMLLYGASLVYGTTGQLQFDGIAAAIRLGDANDAVLLTGLALLLAGLAFKANAAPFHMWTPDAYEGAPTPVTGFMSAATKIAALVIAFRVLTTAFPQEHELWQNVLAGLAVASFAVGNIAALRQNDVKRMLAYSTIGQTGFLLTAVAAGTPLGAQALIFYLVVYALMNLGAFGVVAIRERELERAATIDDFRGYAYRRPVLSVAMVVFMLSLAGIPPTAGFLGKLYVFSAAAGADLVWLALVGAIATMVALVYYLRIPFAVIDREARVPVARLRPGFATAGLVAVVAMVAVVGFFVFPNGLTQFAKDAGASLFQ